MQSEKQSEGFSFYVALYMMTAASKVSKTSFMYCLKYFDRKSLELIVILARLSFSRKKKRENYPV